MTNFSKIYVKGVTTLETESMLKLQNLYIDINDASKANLDIEVENGFMAALSGIQNKHQRQSNECRHQCHAHLHSRRKTPRSECQNITAGSKQAEIHALESLMPT